ncbi:MAG: SPFH domain-containing protein [Patescibacteria group bacterium]
MKLNRGDAWAIVLAVVALVVAVPYVFVGPWLAALMGLASAVTLIRPVTVSENERWVIELFGAYNRVLQPGLHILSVIEQVKARPKTYEQFMTLEVHDTLTQDDIKVTLQTEIFFVLNKEDKEQEHPPAYLATYGVEMEGGTPEAAIRNFGHATLRNIVGSRTFDWATDHQQEIDNLVRDAMQDGVNKWGYRIVRHAIKEFIPPASVIASLEAKLKAEKEGSATVAAAEANKRAQIETAEGAKQATIKAAEAKKQEEILAAEALQRKQILDAEGEARGIELRAKAIEQPGGKDAAQYNIREQEVAALKEIAQKTNTVVIARDLGGLAGLTASGIKLFQALDPTKSTN